MPIDASKVTVHLPRDLNDLELGYDAWTGYFNARGKNFTKRALDARTVEFTTGPMQPREGITVEISMPADAVAKPGWSKEISWWLADNFPYAVFPATLAVCFFSWFFHGRDLPGTGTIVVNYEAPDGLTPAEVGTLVDEQVDLRDISATIIDLAVRGYLKIEEVGTNSWFSSGSDYRFIKLREPQGLKNFEQKLYNKIFGGKSSVTLSDLQEKFYPVLPQVKDDLYRGLSKQGFFDGNPETVRGASFVLGIMLVLAVLAVTCLIQYGLIGRVFFVPVIIAGVLSIRGGSDYQPGDAPEDPQGADHLGEDLPDCKSTSAGPKWTISRKTNVRESSSDYSPTRSSSACRSAGARRLPISIASLPTGINRPGRWTSQPGC